MKPEKPKYQRGIVYRHDSETQKSVTRVQREGRWTSGRVKVGLYMEHTHKGEVTYDRVLYDFVGAVYEKELPQVMDDLKRCQEMAVKMRRHIGASIKKLRTRLTKSRKRSKRG